MYLTPSAGSLAATQEDEQLKRLVIINGAQKWSVVAEKIKVRVANTCGSRWCWPWAL
jgi:hypothetical protein